MEKSLVIVMGAPENANKIDIDFILEFAEKTTPAERAWILHTYERAVAVKGTKSAFFTLRSEFVERYYPEILAKNKPKKAKLTFLDSLKALCN